MSRNALRTRQVRNPATVLQELNMGGRRGGTDVRTGLVKLVLTVVEVVRQVLEKQAVRRVDAGNLTPEEVERLGLAFIEINNALRQISKEFGIKPQELTAEIGSIIKTGDRGIDRASLADLLDRLLDKGAVIAGSVRVAVADIDLLALDLFAMLYPVYKQGKPLTSRRN